MENKSTLKFQIISELLFFDNLALYYIIENTPVPVLARVLNVAEARLAGSILGILNSDQRKAIHEVMAKENDSDRKKNDDAQKALLQIATDLYSRGLIYNSRKHYFGAQSEEKLTRPDS